ncbi:hypothetical protein MIMGU_mgv11b021831mg, partial [Erythranthe guttata]
PSMTLALRHLSLLRSRLQLVTLLDGGFRFHQPLLRQKAQRHTSLPRRQSVHPRRNQYTYGLNRYVSDRSRSRITSSGLMNFMDELLNSEDERIMIFTMNDKEGIDSALLRPQRIDMHIHFPMEEIKRTRKKKK